MIPAAILLAAPPAGQEAVPSAEQSGTDQREQPPPTQAVPEAQEPSGAAPAVIPIPPDSAANSVPAVPPEDRPDTGITVTGRARTPGDPLQQLNARSFAVTQTIDDNVTAPLAHAYEHAMPKPVRLGLRNFLGNLHEPVVFVNFLLQHKIGKAGETLARFAIDTTLGVGGVVDVAKRRPFNLPRRANGFGDTLGFYGVKPGAFMFLPLLGPTTLRDMAGGVLDRLMLPAIPGTPFSSPTWAVPAGAMHTLDKRIEFDDKLAQQRASDDPYAARRDYYLKQRQAEIDALRGKPVTAVPPVQTAMAAPGG